MCERRGLGGEVFEHPVAVVHASSPNFVAFCRKLRQHLLQTLFVPFKWLLQCVGRF